MSQVDSEPDAKWMTWPEAAALVGCPVPTIDWWKRQGRIAYRPHQGPRPSLRRDSVEEFAVWYNKREERRAERRKRAPRPSRQIKPDPTETSVLWGHDRAPLTTQEAADRLGMTAAHVGYLCRTGVLRSVRPSKRLWVDPVSVDDYRRDDTGWVTIADAATIIGCSTTTVVQAARNGFIQRHPATKRGHPSLSATSVQDFAARWRVQKAKQEALRLAEAQAAAQANRAGPPPDGQVWFDAATVAAILGISAGRVQQLAVADRIPHTWHNRRRWFLRSHVEQVAAARVWVKQQQSCDSV